MYINMETSELLVTKPERLMTKNESKNTNFGKFDKKVYI